VNHENKKGTKKIPIPSNIETFFFSCTAMPLATALTEFGLPQLGQLVALSDIIFSQSGHLTIGIKNYSFSFVFF
jgi:hypothetical protein